MNINDLTEAFRDALKNNSALNSWCTSNYSQEAMIYVNLDLSDPPGETDCPYVVLYPVGKQVGERSARKSHNYEIICGLYDTAATTTGQVVEYTGVQNIEALRKLVETALTGADIAPAWVASIGVEYETIENFPFIMAAMAIEIIEEICIGGDYLA